MVLTIHHLQVSQSERLPWLCEELGIPYTLTLHQRCPFFSPQSIKDLNPLGSAPIIQDESLTLCESAACAEYLIHTHGSGKLSLPPGHKNYPSYLYWFHFSNGTLQPHVLLMLQMSRIKDASAGAYASTLQDRFDKMLKLMDERLLANEFLAGEEFTAADIMITFTLTTMRVFFPFELGEYEGILAWLRKVTDREAYRTARRKADPELELMIEGKAPRIFVERLKEQGKL